MSEINRTMLKAMAHSPVRNYAIPGLTSWLIGEPSANGTMRLFSCSRDHQEPITPHSHRFDFQCWVLSGTVRNRIWTLGYGCGDWYGRSSLNYAGDCGQYTKGQHTEGRYEFADAVYEADDWYSMKSAQIHSIYFTAGTEVLFFEGPTISNESLILEPLVDGELIPTFEVKPWMFQRAGATATADTQP
jgi:hypothetical protein